jgi:hypothetical protein
MDLNTLMQMVAGGLAGSDSGKARPRSPHAALQPIGICAVAIIICFVTWWLHVYRPVTTQPHRTAAFVLVLLVCMVCWCMKVTNATPARKVPPQEDLFYNGVSAAQLAKQQDNSGSSSLSLSPHDNSGKPYSFCKHCKIFRPSRAHHCRVCGFCVMDFDHHCDAVDNCVGGHNYKFFLLLLSYAVAACFLAIYLLTIYDGMSGCL